MRQALSCANTLGLPLATGKVPAVGDVFCFEIAALVEDIADTGEKIDHLDAFSALARMATGKMVAAVGVRAAADRVDIHSHMEAATVVSSLGSGRLRIANLDTSLLAESVAALRAADVPPVAGGDPCPQHRPRVDVYDRSLGEQSLGYGCYMGNATDAPLIQDRSKVSRCPQRFRLTGTPNTGTCICVG